MNKIATIILIAIIPFVLVPAAQAQAYRSGGAGDRVELGAFADYFHLEQTDGNYVGVGGRLGFNITRHVQLEGEMNYDFGQTFNEAFFNTGGPGTTTFVRSDLRILHGMFGPKFETRGPVRLFVTAKGGFVNFRFDPRAATFDTFASSVDNLRTDNVTPTFYPGGGIEAFIGPVGFRLEAGDEMYFTNGTHNNLRVTFGPTIRF